LNKTKYLVIIFTLCCCFYGKAQQDTIISKSIQSKKILKKAILPTSLIIGGAFISNSTFEKQQQENIRKGIGKNINTNLDDYLRYAPMTELVVANLIGLKAKNHWFDQAKNLLIIDLTSFITITSLKKIVGRGRPNNQYILNSFPSGHATISFSNATMLYYEYKDTSPFFAYSGYGFAVTTTTLRLLNDRHWLGDVIVGAGIGMLITHLVYVLEPLKNWNPFLKSENISFIPIINNDEIKLQLSWRF